MSQATRPGLALLVGAFLTAATVGLTLVARRPEWQAHQRRYAQLLEARGRSPIEHGIRAIAGRDGEERCVSCHLGTVLPDAFPEPPFRRHPALDCPLPLQELGCTACHRGEALELTVEGAHGLRAASDGGFSPRRVLDWRAGQSRRASLEPGCAQCHLSRERGALRYEQEVVPGVTSGLTLFLVQGCPACHRIAGLLALGENGPSLSEVGRRRSADELREQVLRPQGRNRRSPMPPPRLTAREREELVLFLLAQLGARRELGSSAKGELQSRTLAIAWSDLFPTEVPSSPDPATGALWTRRLGCAGCHKLGERETGVPDLRHVAWYRGRDELEQTLVRPSAVFPGSYMPALDLPETIRLSLVQFLALQRAALPSATEDVYVEVCDRCHGLARDPKSVVLARKPPRLAGRERPLRLAELVATATSGRKGTAMAPWGRVLSKELLSSIYPLAASTSSRGGAAP